ncbi:MAG: hypothetical protein H8E90_00395 [Anaerolineales bacterium]|nr:hypothetical protein [Anaerolineales bacterium]
MNTTELGTVTINGVTFQKVDVGPLLVYEANVDGLAWCVLQPKITDPVQPGEKLPQDGRCHIPYWAANVWDSQDRVCNLNLCTHYPDGTVVKDPFYDLTDSGYTDPPVQLLTAIADCINEGADPWTLEKIHCKEDQR